jgi:hypothetical protein
VLKFVSDLWQDGGFFLNKTNSLLNLTLYQPIVNVLSSNIFIPLNIALNQAKGTIFVTNSKNTV